MEAQIKICLNSDCKSENVIFSKKRNLYFCEDCGCVVSVGKPKKSLKIFISYGHDKNELLIQMIKNDLEKRGHDVWFDKKNIKRGEDWRRSITEGITHSDNFLSFLSKHSTRDPGVCRDEIAIAIGAKQGNIQTILIESEDEVKPPVNIGHIQWLDMQDWESIYKKGKEKWEEWYNEKLFEIISVVESETSRRFAGEIEQLSKYLLPIDSTVRVSDLLNRDFFGREWLFEELEKWRLSNKTESRLFWISGTMGLGKSAFAARLCHTKGDVVLAAQFCEWNKPEHKNAERLISSISFQLAVRLPDYRKYLLNLPELMRLDNKNSDELFDYLLTNPLNNCINGQRERYLIVIDAIDEANDGNKNPLAEVLSRKAKNLPNWIGIVITSRPESNIIQLFRELNPTEIKPKTVDNRNDIRRFLNANLDSYLNNNLDADAIIENILEISEGMFLIAEFICNELIKGNLSIVKLNDFPPGLGAFYYNLFKRHFPDMDYYNSEIEPILGVVIASPEPIETELLQQIFGLSLKKIKSILSKIEIVFPSSFRNEKQVIKIYHKSISEWLTDKKSATEYFVDSIRGNEKLMNFGVQNTKQGFIKAPLFAIKWLPLMFYKAGHYQEMLSLLCNNNYLKIKVDKDYQNLVSKDIINLLDLAKKEKDFVSIHKTLIAITKIHDYKKSKLTTAIFSNNLFDKTYLKQVLNICKKLENREQLIAYIIILYDISNNEKTDLIVDVYSEIEKIIKENNTSVSTLSIFPNNFIIELKSKIEKCNIKENVFRDYLKTHTLSNQIEYAEIHKNLNCNIKNTSFANYFILTKLILKSFIAPILISFFYVIFFVTRYLIQYPINYLHNFIYKLFSLGSTRFKYSNRVLRINRKLNAILYKIIEYGKRVDENNYIYLKKRILPTIWFPKKILFTLLFSRYSKLFFYVNYLIFLLNKNEKFSKIKKQEEKIQRILLIIIKKASDNSLIIITDILVKFLLNKQLPESLKIMEMYMKINNSKNEFVKNLNNRIIIENLTNNRLHKTNVLFMINGLMPNNYYVDNKFDKLLSIKDISFFQNIDKIKLENARNFVFESIENKKWKRIVLDTYAIHENERLDYSLVCSAIGGGVFEYRNEKCDPLEFFINNYHAVISNTPEKHFPIFADIMSVVEEVDFCKICKEQTFHYSSSFSEESKIKEEIYSIISENITNREIIIKLLYRIAAYHAFVYTEHIETRKTALKEINTIIQIDDFIENIK
jgi:hypothetical protein